MKLTIGWLYPELMSTYGDRGNIFVLTKRCQWRKIDVDVVPIDFKSTIDDLQSLELVFGGGAQDRQQGIAIVDLLKKGPALKKLFDRSVPGLFVCGAPQLLGHYYTTGDGKKLPGLGIFDMTSIHEGTRCIGNTIAQWGNKTIVGFENHGGRTYLGKGVKPFAKIIKGCGNNGKDGTEGAVYKNCIATYSHGPFLPKNPHVADWLIAKALEVKYKKNIELQKLDDSLEWRAHEFILHY